MGEKILVAMSGGVDSSVAAALLKEQGHEVDGATLKLFDGAELGIEETESTCCSLSDVEDARAVCYRMGLDHFVFGYSRDFGEQVIGRFASEYAAGRTPNPCIDCNRFIKFPLFLKRARLLGYNSMASGHYARIEKDENTGRWLLKKAADASKDQSYVLYSMTQDELAHCHLPLGDLTKVKVRELAADLDLQTAEKPDSQDICFVPDGDYARFLQEQMGVDSQPGNIVDTKGNVLGKHGGAIGYTIGQRRGLGIASPHPLYVTGKDPETGTVIVGEWEEALCRNVIVDELNWISIPQLTGTMEVTVKTRYRQKEVPATISPMPDGRVKVTFAQPAAPTAAGQAAVFYDGDSIVGGGIIAEVNAPTYP